MQEQQTDPFSADHGEPLAEAPPITDEDFPPEAVKAPPKRKRRANGNGADHDTVEISTPAQEAIGRDLSDAAPEWLPDAGEASRDDPSEFWRVSGPSKDGWPAPIDFWGLTHLPDPDPDWLPPAIGPHLIDLSERIGADPAQAAVYGVGLCAAAIREAISVQMLEHEDRWQERARIWAAIVGDASTKKTAITDALAGHFYAKDAALRRDTEAALKEHEIERKKYEYALAAYIKDSQKSVSAARPTEPTRPPSERLWTDDATLESLGKTLSDHARGKITIIKDELAGWFGSFDAYSNAKDRDRPAYLSAYGGGQRHIDRINEGRSFYVPTWSLCILGSIQPAIMSRLAARGMTEDGMLARFVVCCARPASDGKDRPADREAKIAWVRVLDNLLAMQAGPEPVRFTPEAQQYRREAGRWIHGAMKTGLSAPLIAALGKWEGLFGRLCLTYACIEAAARGELVAPAEIGVEIAGRVWNYMKLFLWPNIFYFYGVTLTGSTDSDALKLANFILARLDDPASRIHTHQQLTTTELAPWAHWRTMQAEDKSGRRRREVLEHLTHGGWITPIINSVQASTRAYTRYALNPAIRERFAEQAVLARAERNRYAALNPFQRTAPVRNREPGED